MSNLNRSCAAAGPLLLGLAFSPSAATAADVDSAMAMMTDRDGQSVGQVELKQTPAGVLLHANLAGLPAGVHAFHIHQTGVCDSPFKSSGGHLASEGQHHGYYNEQGPHDGDMPNIHVPEDGALDIEVMTGVKDLGKEVLDDDGAAIVIHEGADDYETDPAGAAGPRIACGVIETK
ncbi:Cu/Zn superoxide dismutase [Thioflavicoccus mobilis 8321]|uniref:Cu/Zn superoxide dismutase n=1 Tax=Thioflavicoccus mobilis 8321 TaxID=765912 RepID=L0GU56_9GAMM|nr:superoxide dismutase family protein [Thioflavicoccus mobilis]AGA90308.1 Cu/Zn superoxide dismutase [Thioflavicoccus mobilis 8321]